MKQIQNKQPPPIIGGDIKIHDLGISDNPEDQAMVMQILTQSLYTDRVSAVLREVGCNAADANVEAGRGDQPIEVRLPNKLDPTLAIRDFGAGLTEEQVLNTFIRLGSSTKRNSNAFTGMLGIGSKAPFAYGESFLVTSYTNGRRTVYNLYRDRGGFKLAKMVEDATDAPDGIEVKVPIRVENMNEFVDKAERVYRYFRVRPIIHGAKIEWKERASEFGGVGWRYTGAGKSVAIMGNVAYDLNAAAMGFAAPHSPSAAYYSPPLPSSKHETLIELGIELDFKIGDLEIAANREGLQYSDETKKALRRVLDAALQEIGTIFSHKIKSAKSLWDAKLYYHENFEKLETYNRYSLKKLIEGITLWQGKPINSGEFSLGRKDSEDGVNVTKFSRGGRRYGSNVGVSYRTWFNCDNVKACPETTLVINDLPTKKHSPSRLRGWFHQNPDCKDIVVFTFQTAKDEADYWKRVGLTGAPVVKLSTVTPYVNPASGGSTGSTSAHKNKHSAKVFVLDEAFKNTHYGNPPKSKWWTVEDVDLKKDGGVYVTIDTFAIAGLGGQDHPSSFQEKVKALRTAGLIADKVYGFKADRVSKLGPKWKKLEDSIKEQMATKITKGNFAQELADSLAAQDYTPLVPSVNRMQYAVGTPMRKLLDEYERMANPKASRALRELVYHDTAKPWLTSPPLPTASFDLAAQQKKVLASYPMLAMTPILDLQAANAAEIKIIADYIHLVESV